VKNGAAHCQLTTEAISGIVSGEFLIPSLVLTSHPDQDMRRTWFVARRAIEIGILAFVIY